MDEISVAVILYGEMGRRASADPPFIMHMRAELEDRMHELASDLGISGAIAVDVRPRPEQSSDSCSYEIAVNSVACRVDLTATLAGNIGPRQLANALAETVFHNRHLLINEPVANRLISERASDPFAWSLLDRAVRRGFHLGGAMALFDDWLARKPQDWNSYLECALGTRFATSITVELARDQYDILLAPDPGVDGSSPSVETTKKLVSEMRNGLFFELGVRFPLIRFTLGETLEPREFRWHLNQVRAPIRRALGNSELLVNANAGMLASLISLEASPAINSSTGVILALGADLRHHADVFLTRPQLEDTLMRLDRAFPIVLFNCLERFRPDFIGDMLRGLLSEEVSIRDLRSILEALLEAPLDVMSEPERAVDYVRVALKRQIRHQFGIDTGTAQVYELAEEIDALLSADRGTPLSAEVRNRIVHAVWRTLRPNASAWMRQVIVASPVARRPLREVIEMELPRVAVSSRDELLPDDPAPTVRIMWA